MNNALLPTLFQAPELKPLVESVDFDEWQTVVGSSLGEHRSTLRTPAKRFLCRMAWGQTGPLQLLHLEGQGQIELRRVQGSQHGVLWLPLQGWSQERINGTWQVTIKNLEQERQVIDAELLSTFGDAELRFGVRATGGWVLKQRS